MACREKYWAELDDAGKIERLREVVKRLERTVASLSNKANDALVVSAGHRHAVDGTVLMPVDSFNKNERGADVVRRDEKYF